MQFLLCEIVFVACLVRLILVSIDAGNRFTMSEETMLFDILKPYRKAVSSTSPKASVSSAATKLNFSNTPNEGFKRKISNDASPTPKRLRTDSNTSNGSPVVSSPWEMKRLKAELIDAKGQIARLESQIQHQQLVKKETEIYFENEKKAYVEDRKRKEKTMTELEERLQVVRNRENEGKKQLAESVRLYNEFQLKMAKEKQQLKREVSELQKKIIDSSISSNGQMSEMKKDMEELSQALEAAQKEVEHLRGEHERAKAEGEKANRLVAALDKQAITLQQTEQKLKELENDKETYKDWLQQAKISQKRLAAMPGLERELAALRSEVRNFQGLAQQSQMFEEQVHVLNTRLQSLQPVQNTLAQMQVKLKDIEKEIEEWRSVGISLDAPQPSQLAALVENLQQRDLTLATQKLDASSQLTKAKDELLTAKHERDKTQTLLRDLENKQKTQVSLIHRFQKKLLLVSRERDSYRHQLDCYEKDLTVSLAGEGGGGGPAALLPGRVEALEKAIQGYREMVEKMEQDLSANRNENTPALQEQLTRLKDEVDSLKKSNELLRSRKDELEMQLEFRALKGDYDPTKTKIVHMTQNPAAKAQEDLKISLEKAHNEIFELHRKIKKLEQNEMEMTLKLSESMREPNPMTSKEIEQLRNELESHKMKSKKVKDHLLNSLQEFRNVFHMLTGYTFDRISHNIYRLRNMYADSAEDYLTFKLIDDGGIEMVQTDYATQIKDLVDLHLHRQKSFPVFLSALTLDLFSKTTMIMDNV